MVSLTGVCHGFDTGGRRLFIPPSHFVFVRAWEREPTPLSINTIPKEKKNHGRIWIGVIDILGRKHGSKRLLSLQGKPMIPLLVIGKLVTCVPICPLRELLMVNLTSASRI